MDAIWDSRAVSGESEVCSASGLAPAARSSLRARRANGMAPIEVKQRIAAMAAPVTKWSVQVPETRRIVEYIDAAFRIAQANVPGPVFLEMPLDLLNQAVMEIDIALMSSQDADEAGA